MCQKPLPSSANRSRAPDEPSHLHYAVFVYGHGRLPREQPAEVPGEGMQPPLAYLVAAPLFGSTGLDAARVSRDLHEVSLYVYALGPATPGGPSIAFVPNGKRFFSEGGFYHADRRARFVATVPRAPVHAPTLSRPLRLNTGRVRDQWHTMTRSGLSPRLGMHLPEPFVEVHPADAAAVGLAMDGFARVSTRYGA